jgi:hypothetical protein
MCLKEIMGAGTKGQSARYCWVDFGYIEEKSLED